MIKHIVLCGGGPNCFSQMIMIKSLMDHNIIQHNQLKKIYCTSGGSIVGVLIGLKLPLNDIIEYVIQRPWNKIVKFDMDMLFKFNDKKGFYDKELFYKMLSPIFSSNDISLDITLQEMYDQFHIEVRILSLELKSFDLVELCYLTYPNLKVIDAISMSCSFPPIFSPVLYENNYYIDAGIINNYPYNLMMRDIPINEYDSILGINIRKLNNEVVIYKEIKEMNSVEYIQYIIEKSLNSIWKHKIKDIKYELYYDAEHLMHETELFIYFVNNIEYRMSMKEKSELIMDGYLNSLFKNIFNVENNGLAS
jgi:predicted acylesterase/phospholipase RssA